jgi:hypothetical protein
MRKWFLLIGMTLLRTMCYGGQATPQEGLGAKQRTDKEKNNGVKDIL